MLLFLSCLVVSYLSRLANCSPEVTLGLTSLSGASFPDLGVEFFGGIPFAEPPVGQLRFAPPVVKLNPGDTTFDATSFGAACSQFETSTEGLDISEDCLSINVFRPIGLDPSSQVAVMVWVFGGGFLDGAGSSFNGSAIVAQSLERGTPTIYVNLNYRLGPFGFPQGTEAEQKNALNLGHKDVLAALTWVRENIGAFGGDKDKVTVFGQSAGAIIISQLLLNPEFNLARAAILESGSPASASLFNGSRREDDWQQFVSAVPECEGAQPGCTFECLRSASFETIVAAAGTALDIIQEEFPFCPTIDGHGGIIPDLPSVLFARGQFSKIPIITGTNMDEGTLFTPSTFSSSEQLREWLFLNTTPSTISTVTLDEDIDTILELYPDVPALGSPFGTGNETFGLNSEYKRASAVLGDLSFQSLRRQTAQIRSQQGAKVFAYLFTDPQPEDPPSLGVEHGSEVLYVYGVAPNGPASVVLSHNMIDYWLSFANSLNPNDGLGNSSRTLWTEYTPSSENVLQLNSEDLVMIPDTYRAKQIGFINANPVAFRH
ncbi:hypothetical protein M0805_009757 [Coniferiporia weirii]|nr:hypothetical protein M0805_009757 [Coniferiporia weirii]